MEFARKQLEKYGWSEGKGLGRHEDGISTALKPKLKFDNAGLGHNIGDEYKNNWWEKVFNSAAANLDVDVSKDEIKMKLKSKEPIEISTKGDSLKQKKKHGMEYGLFLKVSRLSHNGEEHYTPIVDDSEPSCSSKVNALPLTDEQLFAACGGRTAHKGARHGLKLSGKLSRLEKQERMLLKKMRKVSLSDDSEKEKVVTEKKLKKLKKQKEHDREKYTPIKEDSLESVCSNGLRMKKKRKSVSFNDTVTVTKYAIDPDTSFEQEACSSKEENVNDQNLEGIASGSDEGIEQDIENNNNDIEDNHRSFEVAQFKISDLSRTERKKLKKKRKLESRKNIQTGLYLQKLNDDECEEDENAVDMDERVNKKKRKYLEECDVEGGGFSVIEFSGKSIKQTKIKKKRKKQKKLEERISSITRSLDNVCRISESE
nr:unnamed protein product [Callosobruchus chinensis]